MAHRIDRSFPAFYAGSESSPGLRILYYWADASHSVMGSVARTGEDSGNNPPQKSHARTVRALARTVRDYMRTFVVVCGRFDWIV
jgi:hypothetical protein